MEQQVMSGTSNMDFILGQNLRNTQQLTTQTDDFEFILKTDITRDTLGHFIGGLYEDCFANDHPYQEYSIFADYIPTKYMLFSQAFSNWEHHYYHFAMNGHDLGSKAEIEEAIEYALENGEDTEEAVRDVLEGWLDFRLYNNIYTPAPEWSNEFLFMQDINKALMLYHMSYIKDKFDYNVYSAPERVIIEEWVNPPIVGVW